jgi:hypothetical protein
MNRMNRFAITLSMLAFSALLAGLPQVAHAQNNVDDYRDGMPGLFDVADSWMIEVERTLILIETKPEMACGDAYAELLFRGRSIVDDLSGSIWNAPEGLMDTHDMASAGLSAVLGGARHVAEACDGSTLVEGRAQIEQGRQDYSSGIAPIQDFLDSPFTVDPMPFLPVTPPAIDLYIEPVS